MGQRQQPAYIQWLDFIQHTDSEPLRAAMMDLHWFQNNGSLRLGVRDLLRFGFYALRWLASPRMPLLRRSDLTFVVDTPGVGGVETLLPLLRAKPVNLCITLAVTDFIAQDERLVLQLQADPSLQIINMDRIRVRMGWNGSFFAALIKLGRRHPRLCPAIPLFFLRHSTYVACATELFEATGARAVVVFNERMLPSACFTEAARLSMISTCAVQHGNFVDNYVPVRVDHYLTWGRFHNAWLSLRGTCQTTAIGAPRLDALVAAPTHAWHIPSDRPPHLVFFSQVGSATVPPEWISRTRRMILGLATRGEMRVTVKLHPLDTRERWNSEGPAADCVRYLDGSVTMAEALRDADLTSSFYSTVLAEALLYDLPVVQLNPYPESVPHFPDREGILSVESEAALLDLVTSWRDSEATLHALRDHQRVLREGYFSHLGHACERFWEVAALQIPVPMPSQREAPCH